MNRNTYRICLVMLILIAVISAVWYYQMFGNKELNPKEGTFVWETAGEGNYV